MRKNSVAFVFDLLLIMKRYVRILKSMNGVGCDLIENK
jgi:hypothetical protein